MRSAGLKVLSAEVRTQLPERQLQGGVQLIQRGERWDVRLMAFEIDVRNPRYTLDAQVDRLANTVRPTVTLDYPRTCMLGAGGSLVLGNWVLRSEAAWQSDAALPVLVDGENAGAALAQETGFLLGLDRLFADGWLISGQYYRKDYHADGQIRHNGDFDIGTLLVRSDPFAPDGTWGGFLRPWARRQ